MSITSGFARLLDETAAFTAAVDDCQEAEPLLLETMRRDTDALAATAVVRGTDGVVMQQLMKNHRAELTLAKTIGTRATQTALAVLAHVTIQSRLRARILKPWAQETSLRDIEPLAYTLEVAGRLAASKPALPATYHDVTLEAQ
jgi:hypothetical protein